MKSFDRIFIAAASILAVIIAAANIILLNINSYDNGRPYRVEISRLALEIEQKGADSVDLSECEYVTDIIKYKNGDKNFYSGNSDYSICEIKGELYRFDYSYAAKSNKSKIIFTLNIILGIITLLILGIMLFIRQVVINPFDKMKNVPLELSKGNLTVPIKENKSRFFGRFIWGIDMLRETMEQQKQRELEFQREKKTLLLSISHDIKTPLSAIKLYAKALSKGLYTNKYKQLEIADCINDKADEIESFVSEIIKASNEDFLRLEVIMDEFYLSHAIDKIAEYYTEKLLLIGTDFSIGQYSDCILKGDLNRLIEILQNIIENAAKYGDGHTISIDFSEEEECKLITIKNSGCTLPNIELPHIFDSFWRGSNVGSNQGSGLGLYICRQLMHKMGGEIFSEIKDNFMCITIVLIKC